MIRLAKYFPSGSFSRTYNMNMKCYAATQTAVKTAKIEKVEKAGTGKESQSFTTNIFRGQLQINQVFPFPEPLNAEQIETIRMFLDPMEKFFEEVNDPARNDEAQAVDEKVISTMWDLGGFCLQVPNEYGGLGLNNTQYTRCVEICGYYDLAFSIVLGAHMSIGFKGITLFGTPEQKKEYLPRVCNREYAAFCLTEPSCGSDASAIQCRAVKSDDGSHYILNGSKIWISNGGIADIFTVFAKVPVKDPKTGETKDIPTAFIVERGFGGVTNGPPEKKMGIKASNTSALFFEDVKIPVENRLGEEGQGFKIAMNILNNGRFGMVAALADGYGSIQEKLARMTMLQYVTESLAYMISGNMDKGSQDYHLEAAIGKCFASESAWWVCDEAIQIHGGMGYMKDTGLERILRDLRIFRIFEGLIVEEAAKRATRAIGLNSSSNFAHLVHPSLADSAALCTKNIESFGACIETTLVKYGRGIVDEQFILHRIAQAAVDIYTMVVVMSRATMAANKNIASAQHELLMAQTWCEEASSRATYNLKVVNSKKHLDLFDNFSKISRNVCDGGGCVQLNPLGF
ncbi:hypothetical protein HZH66_002988 [Vespula vulgaris]|uniref:Very long-chain specific acyl-CoA dehydrogenase, mitochondrial n=1 Tax=Vespula vulgaris TaxID=7454 RepID=A0A834KQR1_VESVU|nr:hypothetical protein HZH66_002988 [Vespula vulgaris]